MPVRLLPFWDTADAFPAQGRPGSHTGTAPSCGPALALTGPCRESHGDAAKRERAAFLSIVYNTMPIILRQCAQKSTKFQLVHIFQIIIHDSGLHFNRKMGICWQPAPDYARSGLPCIMAGCARWGVFFAGTAARFCCHISRSSDIPCRKRSGRNRHER